MPTVDSRALYLRTLADEDILGSLRGVNPDTLVEVGAGLAIEAYEGMSRYISAREVAAAFYDIPPDVCDLLAATALATLYPATGAVILARPGEDAIDAILREVGLKLAARAEAAPGTRFEATYDER